MRIEAPFLHAPATRAVIAALAPARVWFVGGAVRNAVMGQPVTDIDLATDALPGTVMQRAGAAGLRVVPTGIDHGTVTVVADGLPHEVTTLRRDVATDGRRAVVAFTDDIALDAARRDFTMNALYALPDGTVVDPVGGLPDALAGRVRFVGDPATRIAEDALRVLRFFRFHACYGDPAQGIDAEGLAACATAIDRLAPLSRERVGWEMRKLLSAPDPAPAVAAMAQAGVLGAVLPGADATFLPQLVHVEPALRWQRRLVLIAPGEVTDALRLSRDEAREIAAIRAALASDLAPAALSWAHGRQAAEDALVLRAALSGQVHVLDTDELSRGASAVFPLRASDLPDLTGPALGAALKAAEARWLASNLRLSRSDLLP
jgi:poly(A) polymerase